ncbi:DUF4097 family beta strand repeat-containing protein [Arenicella xantha]|uniref:Adhesin n=1 Tax=Arenicella xantha TaxID=644221 RepID=A0A395JIU1_9GAMM|nr:DUF4097 family beta strand repeat-containing protein [Arenicella xantha]RBP48857.1 hypothetical protein DFR28_105196 [Arenicella xantha]
MTKKLPFLVGGAVIGLLALGISQAKPSQTERTYKVNSGGTLYLDSDSGSVEVESHDRDSIEVRVEKKGANADDFKITISQIGDDIMIAGEKNGGGFFGYNLSVRYEIKVPKRYNVELDTGGGSIEITDLEGTVAARTSGGSIELGKIVGDVDVKTSGGSISIDDVAGNLNAHTSGGSIKAKISKQPTENSRLTTSGGSVTAYLAEDIAVDITASTSGGRVTSDFDVDGKVKKTSIRGKINGGGPTLTLKTSGGSVRIKEL